MAVAGIRQQGRRSTGRTMLAQPADTIGGAMRVTEQGEVVSSNFKRGTGLTVEILAASVFAHSVKSPNEPELKDIPEFIEALEALTACRKPRIRASSTKPGFIDYFHQASPVEELSLLKIGSGRRGASAPAAFRSSSHSVGVAWSQTGIC